MMAKKEPKPEVTPEVKLKEQTMPFNKYKETKRSRKEHYLLAGMAVTIDITKERTLAEWEKELTKFKKRSISVG